MVAQTHPPEPFFVNNEAIAPSQALLAMGDEALPAILELFLHKRDITSDTMPRELTDRSFLEGS